MWGINQLPRVKKTNQYCIDYVIFIIVTGLIAIEQEALAADESKFSATATFATEYIWHGYSKSDGNPVFQANLDYHHSTGFFGGLWFSQVDFGDDRTPGFKHLSELEFIPYFGYAFSIADDWHTDVQWSRYIYNGNFFNRVNEVNKSANYNEFAAAINFRDLLTARIGVTDNGYGRGGIYPVYEFIGRYPITDLFDFSAKVGYVESQKALQFDYLYWDAGIGFYYKYIALDFRYIQSTRHNHRTNRPGFEEIKPTFVFTVSLGF